MSTRTPHDIRPLSWKLMSESPLTPTFYALSIPLHWKEALLDLTAQSQPQKPREKLSIPCDGLHRAFNALVGDIISIEPKAWSQWNPPKFWLYADIDTYSEIERRKLVEGIHQIVLSWADEMWTKKVDNSARRTALKALQSSDLAWEKLNPDFSAWGVEENGTAKPTSPYAFRLLPHWIAAQLSHPNVRVQIGSSSRELRRVPLAPGENGAELMTWPPEQIAGRRSGAYSVVFKFSAQTRPFQNYPVVNCEISTRRWATPNTARTSGNTNVYLQSSVPWLPALRHTRSFQVAPARWGKETTIDGEVSTSSDFIAFWSKDSHLTQILHRLLPTQRAFPDADAVFKAPEKWFTPHAERCAAIVYSTRMGSYPVGAGHFPANRKYLAEQIHELLLPIGLDWAPAPVPQKFPSGLKIQSQDKLFSQALETQVKGEKRGVKKEKANAEEIKEHRRLNLPVKANQQLHIEFFYQRELAYQAFEKTLRTFLGVDDNASFPLMLDDGRTLHYSAQLLGALGSPLHLANTRRASTTQIREAALARCHEVRQVFSSQSADQTLYPTLSIIELHGKDGFKGANDPKHALRAGFAGCGRLTQFVELSNDDKPNIDKVWPRAWGGLLDGMRQLGIVPYLPDGARVGLPSSLKLMAFWLKKLQNSTWTRQNDYVPLFLRIDSQTRSIEVKALGFEQWLPYRQAQLALANPFHPSSRLAVVEPVFKDNEVRSFIAETMRHHVTEDTVLFCHAQNARSCWKWLTDTQITPEGIRFMEKTQLEGPEVWSSLRVIRMRSYTNGEVPQHFASKEEGVTQPSGLYAWEHARFGSEDSPRVFGSISPKPSQFAGLKLDFDRFDETGDTIGKNAWNPRLAEITTAFLQPQDRPEAWAAFAHALRNSAAHYGSDTAMPVPLHLLMKMDEYVLPL